MSVVLEKASINVEFLLGVQGPLKSLYLIVCVGEDVARNLVVDSRRNMIS